MATKKRETSSTKRSVKHVRVKSLGPERARGVRGGLRPPLEKPLGGGGGGGTSGGGGGGRPK